ncbi:hypothetical protein [Citrobacter cronae]|nr:hypothetical protein [Citrobacter cronae]MBJ8366257.1 hypothetical protein [Citrobacter cronae]MBJ8395160.1 hypothetical protein [Citrobacter cronae]MBJ8408027.1 hypothetical protein [Citrobacter cronae]
MKPTPRAESEKMLQQNATIAAFEKERHRKAEPLKNSPQPVEKTTEE